MIINPEHIRKQLKLSTAGSSRTCPPLPGIHNQPTLPAAVLLPLVLDEDIWKLLFIKRTQHKNDPHSGQIAFPGGRMEENDLSLEFTALREAHEEIGLHPADIEVLGQSCSITTVTDYEITPYVGLLPWPYDLKLSPEEVEKIILIPIDWLEDPKNHQTKNWESRSRAGVNIPVIFFSEFEGEILWGATAQIVADFLMLVKSIP